MTIEVLTISWTHSPPLDADGMPDEDNLGEWHETLSIEVSMLREGDESETTIEIRADKFSEFEEQSGLNPKELFPVYPRNYTYEMEGNDYTQMELEDCWQIALSFSEQGG